MFRFVFFVGKPDKASERGMAFIFSEVCIAIALQLFYGEILI